MLGIRTPGLRMVGADESIELWRPPTTSYFYVSSYVDKQNEARFSRPLSSHRNASFPESLHELQLPCCLHLEF